MPPMNSVMPSFTRAGTTHLHLTKRLVPTTTPEGSMLHVELTYASEKCSSALSVVPGRPAITQHRTFVLGPMSWDIVTSRSGLREEQFYSNVK